MLIERVLTAVGLAGLAVLAVHGIKRRGRVLSGSLGAAVSRLGRACASCERLCSLTQTLLRCLDQHTAVVSLGKAWVWTQVRSVSDAMMPDASLQTLGRWSDKHCASMPQRCHGC